MRKFSARWLRFGRNWATAALGLSIEEVTASTSLGRCWIARNDFWSVRGQSPFGLQRQNDVGFGCPNQLPLFEFAHT